MKNLLLIAALSFSTALTAQSTITSVGDGNATNPFIWDCLCFPTPSDNVIINHDIVMNVDWIVNAGGSITVNSSGSFVEDANYRSILIDGNGSEFVNNGFSDLTNLVFTNGANGINTSDFLLDTALYVDGTSSFTNSGVIVGTDSILVNGTFTNNTGGELSWGDFWNNGTMTNAGTLYADSLLNTASFNSTGAIYCHDFGNDGPFTHSAQFFIEANFYNADNITFTSSAVVLVGNDMLSGDTLGGSASIVNDGGVRVANDFLNTDALSGSGRYCIANSSTNTGAVTGTLDICDETPGGGFDVNLGSVAGTVTNCSTPCEVGLEDLPKDEVLIYPNPANKSFTIEYSHQKSGLVYFELYNMIGEVVSSNQLLEVITSVDISTLQPGVYLCRIWDENGWNLSQRIVKE